jgi:hypothetical protein
VPFEAVKRFEEFASGQGGEANHAYVDAHLRGRRPVRQPRRAICRLPTCLLKSRGTTASRATVSKLHATSVALKRVSPLYLYRHLCNLLP